jgi:serine/threonine protein kinase
MTEKIDEYLKVEAVADSQDERIRQVVERMSYYIAELIKNFDSKLGEGQTAEVHALESDEDLCCKIINIAEGTAEVPFNPPALEMRFLAKLTGLTDARVPKPHCAVSCDSQVIREALDFKFGMKLLFMEKLNAVSVRDVLRKREKMPAGFDYPTFFSKLSAFLEKMHDLRVYHRDLHDGNIMIDRETGEPYVIDFGSAAESFGDDNPYVDRGVGEDIRYVSDEVNLGRVAKLVREFLTKPNLTNKA